MIPCGFWPCWISQLQPAITIFPTVDCPHCQVLNHAVGALDWQSQQGLFNWLVYIIFFPVFKEHYRHRRVLLMRWYLEFCTDQVLLYSTTGTFFPKTLLDASTGQYPAAAVVTTTHNSISILDHHHNHSLIFISQTSHLPTSNLHILLTPSLYSHYVMCF